MNLKYESMIMRVFHLFGNMLASYIGKDFEKTAERKEKAYIK
jgi:hypothetical protein